MDISWGNPPNGRGGEPWPKLRDRNHMLMVTLQLCGAVVSNAFACVHRLDTGGRCERRKQAAIGLLCVAGGDWHGGCDRAGMVTEPVTVITSRER